MTTVLSVRDLRVALGKRPVLRAVSFDMQASSIVTLLGPNGCGKTTLLKSVAGLVRPSSGEIELQGRALSSFSVRELATKVAYLPQHGPETFPYSVREFVEFGRSPHCARFSVRFAGSSVDGILAQFGLDSVAETPITALSGGELQRVRIARVTAQGASLILLDEPATALDLKYQHLVAQLLCGFRATGKTALCSTHDPTFALRISDQIMLMRSDGQVSSPVRPDRVTEGELSSVYDEPIRIVQVPEVGAVCCTGDPRGL